MTRLSSLSFFGLVACAASLGAQNPIAFPQESTATTTGNFIPLGYSKINKSYSEGRYQQLVPARYLPSNASVIVGIDMATLAGAGSTAITYKSLQITLSTTSATSLSTTFKSNLPRPQVVYTATDTKITFVNRQWTRIRFKTPFLFDASGGIVVEFQKVVDESAQAINFSSHLTDGDPGRRDLPRPVYNFGTYKSGAATATTSRFSSVTPLKFRLATTGPTLTIGSDPGGASRYVFPLGGSLVLTNHDGVGNRFQNLISVGYAASPFPLFGGRVYLSTPNLPLNGGIVGAGGSVTLKATIPNLATLVGAQLVFQGVGGPASAPRLTNSVDCIVNK